MRARTIAAAGAICLFGFSAVATAEKPNIIVIVADDVGWADVAYHGSPILTPHIDRLAREGVELDQHYVAPFCTPTRAALLSGRYWSRFGVTTPSNNRVFPWDTWTLPRALKPAGYHTAIVGKWHLGSKPEWGPMKFGFDQSYGSLAGGVTPYTHLYRVKAFAKTWHRNDTLLDEEGHVTDLIAVEAVRVIEADRAEPFFLYVPFTAAHDPFDEPEPWLRSAAHIDDNRRQYAACVQHMDAAIGQIIDALERTGRHKNTLVVFFSDNGGTNRDGSASYPGGKANSPVKGLNHPLRGWKTELYEGGIRVPALIHWPGKLAPAKLSTPVHVVDWMPTLCAIAGVEEAKDSKWDGVNLLPHLTGDPAASLVERELYWQGPGNAAAVLRRGDWKLVVHRRNAGEKIELYDLAADSSETTDLADKHPDRVATMLAALRAQIARDNDAIASDTERQIPPAGVEPALERF